MQQQKDRFLIGSAIILLVVHAAGVIGVHSAHSVFFLSLTPVNLLLSVFLLLLNHNEFNKPFFFFAALTFLAGYFIEVIGVHTGIIFGHYFYGDTLGLKILKIPVIIGFNWLMLIYCAGVVSNKIETNILFKSIIGALILVILDNLIEPVATTYGFWSWTEGVIPAQNFVAWFIVSLLLLLLFHSLTFNKQNKIASLLLIIQFLFFMLIRIL